MNISIIGAGNLGTQLTLELSVRGHDIVQVFSRDRMKAKDLAEQVEANEVTDLNEIQTDVDLVLIAVSDNAIHSVSNSLPNLSGKVVVAHTAGSIPSDALSNHGHFGVFYPLQTFSTDSDVAWDVIPLLITANDQHSKRILTALAESVNERAQHISDDERLYLHLCATFANNFANHMFALAKDIADEAELDFNLLKPLIRETSDKVMAILPRDAQTGPALRGDNVTMEKHLKLLEGSPELQKLYHLISQSIRDI